MIAINLQNVIPSRSGFVKKFFFSPFCVIRDFIKGHFIDDSNEYKFIYVPTSSSSEKHIFDDRWVLNFFSGESLSQSNKSLDKGTLIFPCDRSLHPVSHVANCCDCHIFCILIVLSGRKKFNFRFQCPCYKRGTHA